VQFDIDVERMRPGIDVEKREGDGVIYTIRGFGHGDVVEKADPCLRRVNVGEELCQKLHAEQMARYQRSDYSQDREKEDLGDLWMEMTQVISRKVYHRHCCERCEESIEHDDCEVEV
jgi:hypothetical protein